MRRMKIFSLWDGVGEVIKNGSIPDLTCKLTLEEYLRVIQLKLGGVELDVEREHQQKSKNA